jgi:anti-sigma regulatory factor (Ser/Thr protein kinase)
VTAAQLDHVALLYGEATAAVEQIAALVERDRVQDTSVLVCLSGPMTDELQRRVGTHAAVTFLAAEQRYSRPVEAMNLLWRFTQDALARGATRVHSIGEIAFDGSSADGDWHWYERAVNEVFAEVPMRATCLVDVQRVPPSAIGCLHATHRDVVGDPVALGALPGLPECHATSLLPRSVPVPERPADLVLPAVERPATARRAVRAFIGGGHAALSSRAELVVSELVTNAVLHGGGSADVRCWSDAEGLTLQVTDDGSGIADLMAPLRPPSLPDRGAGLWTANLESERLHIGHRDPHGTVVTVRIA